MRETWLVLVPTWPHTAALSGTPGMSPACNYRAHSNWSLATYPFFSSSKLLVKQSSSSEIWTEGLTIKHSQDTWAEGQLLSDSETILRNLDGGSIAVWWWNYPKKPGERVYCCLGVKQSFSFRNLDGGSIGYIHIRACTTRVVQTAAGVPIAAVLSIAE